MLLIPLLDWQRCMPWFWLAVMLVCSLVEACTMTLTTLWFAIAALVMVFASMLPLPLAVQLLLFALMSVALLLFTRPFALKFLRLRRTATNSDALVGKRCTLAKAVPDGGKGSVRINGVVWAAASEDGSSIEEGKECIIKEIQGNTLIVAVGKP